MPRSGAGVRRRQQLDADPVEALVREREQSPRAGCGSDWRGAAAAAAPRCATLEHARDRVARGASCCESPTITAASARASARARARCRAARLRRTRRDRTSSRDRGARPPPAASPRCTARASATASASPANSAARPEIAGPCDFELGAQRDRSRDPRRRCGRYRAAPGCSPAERARRTAPARGCGRARARRDRDRRTRRRARDAPRRGSSSERGVGELGVGPREQRRALPREGELAARRDRRARAPRPRGPHRRRARLRRAMWNATHSPSESIACRRVSSRSRSAAR